MNNTFDINRFGLLLRRQIQEFGKIYIISLGILIGITVLIYILSAPDFVRPGFQDLKLTFRYPTIIILGFLFISVISSNYFASWGQKPRAIIEIMLPSSRLEKFLAGVLFGSIISTISFLVLFFAVDYVMIGYIESRLEVKQELIGFWSLINSTEAWPFIVYPIIILPLTISSIFMLGSIYFEKYHYLKTAITVMIIFSAMSWAYYKTAMFLFEGKHRNNVKLFNMDEYDVAYTSAAILFLLTICIWAIGFIRLKEKEV